MKSQTRILILLPALLMAGNALAVPFSFSAGEPARADDVNANFTDVENQITANDNDIGTLQTQVNANTNAIANMSNGVPVGTPPVYDYKDYATAPGITSKTFAINRTGCGATEQRNISRTGTPPNTSVTVERVRFNGATRCRTEVFFYQNTETERSMLGKETRTADGTTLDSTIVFDTPVVQRTSTMVQGSVIGSSSSYTLNMEDPQLADEAGMFMQNSVALGVEDVTVPAGTYTACLKMSLHRASDHLNTFMRYSWYCAGYGEVKRTISRIAVSAGVLSQATRTWEMTAVTP